MAEISAGWIFMSRPFSPPQKAEIKSEVRKLNSENLDRPVLPWLRRLDSDFRFLASGIRRAPLGAAHCHAHAFELRAQAGVYHPGADFHDQPAQQGRIHFRLELDFARQLRLQDRLQLS